MARDLFDRSMSATCRICQEVSIPRSYLCVRCRALKERIETRKGLDGRGRKVHSDARLWAMWDQWDGNESVFRCKYTGVPLSEVRGSRRYATWEHATPGDEASVVLVADLVNKMKVDMTEPEFRDMVAALARRFEGHDFDAHAFPADRLPPDVSAGSIA